jgi:glycerate 2-kinase
MNVLIAPNAYKNSLDAAGVAAAIAEGLRRSALKPACVELPMADGGDGTLAVLQRITGCELYEMQVSGPYGEQVPASWGWMAESGTAVIEMAESSGLRQVRRPSLDPTIANTYGAGQLVRAALQRGARRILIGLGGSATVDGGLGFLQALGARLCDAGGRELPVSGNPLIGLSDMDVTEMKLLLGNAEIVVLSDVDNPLTGPRGSVRVFGPQKGATPAQMEVLETSMERFSALIERISGTPVRNMPGAGAAGGFAAALRALCGAAIVPGAGYVLDLAGFDEALAVSDLVVTAEGKADGQTEGGKGPQEVARRAAIRGIPVILLAGTLEPFEAMDRLFTACFSISRGPKQLEEALADTQSDLEFTARQIGNLLALARG